MEKYIVGFIVGVVVVRVYQKKMKDISDEVDRDLTLLEKYEEGRHAGFKNGREFQSKIDNPIA